MFFQDVKAAWQEGNVRVGLPPHGHGTHVTVEASGWLGFKAWFLSKAEKAQLADAAKADAQRVDNTA